MSLQVGLPEQPRHIPRHERYRTLSSNWELSQRIIGQLQDGLEEELPRGVKTIAIAGSFGRFEASDQSDADTIVILDESVDEPAEKEVGAAAIEIITRRIAYLGIPEPNPRGVFRDARRFERLLPPDDLGWMGDAEEPMDVLGKRMLMLLESRALVHHDAYVECRDAILDRYTKYVRSEPTKEHLVLLNDLIRFFRFICMNYQSSFERENEKWALRNIKLRHSRVVMYMGLLCLLGESSKYSDERKLSLVRERLDLTPLERIASVYADNQDSSFYRVAGAYETFLARISDGELRGEINALDYERRYDNPMFSTLKANSDALQAEFTRFILARRGQWSERFFEYLIF